MADTEPRGPGRPPTESVMAKAFEKMLEIQERQARIAEQVQANTKPRELDFGDAEYQQRLHDEGFYTELETPAFQNGRDIEPRGLQPETIHRLARLAPGQYLNKMVEVEVTPKGYRHLRYKSASIEDRMRQPWTSLDDLVARIWAEMPQPA